MTIEEYLKISAEEIENTIPKGDNCDGNIYLAGKVDAYREILEKLPEMEHEVTLREVVEECLKHESDGGCENCVFMRTPSYSVPCYCWLGIMPKGWDIDDIERRMKEARND